MEEFKFSRLILGSASPRRKKLLQDMGFDFEVVPTEIDEVYPGELKHYQIPDYLCLQKANSLKKHLKPGTLILTADTVVWHKNKILEKPSDPAEAYQTLKELSGKQHEVITSVCFSSKLQQIVEHSITQVKFAPLSDAMIQRYVSSGQAMDKAGAYGIQEWIGLVGVEYISGSYTNVVGFPTELVYKTLRVMVGTSV